MLNASSAQTTEACHPERSEGPLYFVVACSSHLRASARFLWFTLLLLAATADGLIRRPRVGPEGAIWVHRWCRRITRAMGLRCTVTGTPPQAGPLALVSNHLSYLDVLLYSAATPFIMVSKTEVRGWPLIGWITAQAGTIYVERADVAGGQSPKKPRQTHEEVNAQMAVALNSGLPVLFFPEGTTTNGEDGVMPFRRGLFHSVLRDAVPMRAAALRYTLIQPNPGASVADDVCYWGDADFLKHLFRFLSLRGFRAHIHFGAEDIPGDNRFTLAVNAHEAVTALYTALEHPSSQLNSL